MAFFRTISKNEYRVILAMILAAILIGIPVYAPIIYAPEHNDFTEHIYFASLLADGQFRKVPGFLSHPVYQLLLAGLYWMLFRQAGMRAIALLVQILVQILLVLLIYFWLGREDQQKWKWIRAALAVSLSLVAPVMALVFWDGLYYLGYIGAANYHNPTSHLLKPVALLSFTLLPPIFNASQKRGKTALLAFLTILSALIKPNYLLCILPAAGAVAVVYLIKRKTVNWRPLVLGLLLPGTLILLAQYVIAYNIRASDEGGIVFSPLSVMSEYSGYLLPKLILSMLFPLAVLALNFRKAARDPALMLAWAGFLAGLAQTYLLAEGGGRFSHGNFGWGAEIMLFILFVVSVSFLWREWLAAGSWRRPANGVILAAYLAHVVAGIAYWIYAMGVEYPW